MRAFKPATGLRNRHLQTLYSAFFRGHSINHFEEEAFELADGDFVDCFWVNKPIDQTSSTPIVVLFHGLTGSYQSSYIQGMMLRLQQSNYACVLMHFRGCAGRENRTARAYHSGDTGDALAWALSLTQRYPQSDLYAIGYSLGGNMLLKLLAEQDSRSLFKAAVAISSPMQLDICAKTMQLGFARFYQQYLLKPLKRSLLKKFAHFNYQNLINLSKEQVHKITTIEQFDDLYTAPIHGFENAKNYYNECSAKQFLTQITTTTLIINAKDDPFMTPAILPSINQISKNIETEFTQHGGHLGFISGHLFKPSYWLEDRVMEFFEGI